jgi:hypothetical protein
VDALGISHQGSVFVDDEEYDILPIEAVQEYMEEKDDIDYIDIPDHSFFRNCHSDAKPPASDDNCNSMWRDFKDGEMNLEDDEVTDCGEENDKERWNPKKGGTDTETEDHDQERLFEAFMNASYCRSVNSTMRKEYHLDVTRMSPGIYNRPIVHNSNVQKVRETKNPTPKQQQPHRPYKASTCRQHCGDPKQFMRQYYKNRMMMKQNIMLPINPNLHYSSSPMMQQPSPDLCLNQLKLRQKQQQQQQQQRQYWMLHWQLQQQQQQQERQNQLFMKYFAAKDG